MLLKKREEVYYMGYSLKRRKEIFEKASPVRGKNPALYRIDDYGNRIFFKSYGLNSKMGWEIDHKNPKSKGGSDKDRNLRPLNTAENRRKGARYPY